MEEDGRRLPGIVPSATILMVSSTRYKINGAQAIAFTYTTSRIRSTTISAEAVRRPHLPGWILSGAPRAPDAWVVGGRQRLITSRG